MELGSRDQAVRRFVARESEGTLQPSCGRRAAIFDRRRISLWRGEFGEGFGGRRLDDLRYRGARGGYSSVEGFRIRVVGNDSVGVGEDLGRRQCEVAVMALVGGERGSDGVSGSQMRGSTKRLGAGGGDGEINARNARWTRGGIGDTQISSVDARKAR